MSWYQSNSNTYHIFSTFCSKCLEILITSLLHVTIKLLNCIELGLLFEQVNLIQVVVRVTTQKLDIIIAIVIHKSAITEMASFQKFNVWTNIFSYLSYSKYYYYLFETTFRLVECTLEKQKTKKILAAASVVWGSFDRCKHSYFRRPSRSRAPLSLSRASQWATSRISSSQVHIKEKKGRCQASKQTS